MPHAARLPREHSASSAFLGGCCCEINSSICDLFEILLTLDIPNLSLEPGERRDERQDGPALAPERTCLMVRAMAITAAWGRSFERRAPCRADFISRIPPAPPWPNLFFEEGDSDVFR
jgi:hypothetical protein